MSDQPKPGRGPGRPLSPEEREEYRRAEWARTQQKRREHEGPLPSLCFYGGPVPPTNQDPTEGPLLVEIQWRDPNDHRMTGTVLVQAPVTYWRMEASDGTCLLQGLPQYAAFSTALPAVGEQVVVGVNQVGIVVPTKPPPVIQPPPPVPTPINPDSLIAEIMAKLQVEVRKAVEAALKK